MIVVFNEPGTVEEPDDSLLRCLLRCFRVAERGSTVWGSVMAWSNPELTGEAGA